MNTAKLQFSYLAINLQSYYSNLWVTQFDFYSHVFSKNLRGNSSFSKPYTQVNHNTTNVSQFTNKIQKLKAFSLVKTDGICESLVS